MVDTLDEDLAEDELVLAKANSNGEREIVPPAGMSSDRCQWVDRNGERCELFLPEGHHPTRKYCEGHRPDGPLRRVGKKPKGDTPPVNVNIKLGGAKAPAKKLTDDQQRVLDAATAWLGLVTEVLRASGDTVCADAAKEAAPQIALQLALLAEFHPIIVKILAPVEATGEALIWVSLLVAASPLIITVLTHHKVISEEVAQRIGIVTAMGAVVGAQSMEAEAREAA